MHLEGDLHAWTVEDDVVDVESVQQRCPLSPHAMHRYPVAVPVVVVVAVAVPVLVLVVAAVAVAHRVPEAPQ